MPNIIQELKDFLLKSFNKDPTKRPTAQELLDHPWVMQAIKTGV
jgi:serine/threonine protein kinase